MQVSGRTRLVGIFGDPVAHSLSPRMQNAALQACGIDAVYVPFHVTPARLNNALQGLRALGVRGVNLTIPHKEAACPLLDALDPEAALIGAVNTVVNDGGCLVGYNTDGLGLLAALQDDFGFTAAGRNIVLMGAGGACRAALVALSRAGAARITIANRTPERAASLIAELQPHFPGTALALVEFGAMSAAGKHAGCDLLVNTSAVGLKGDSFASNVTACVASEGIVYDMVYGERPTPLMETARNRGLRTADGRGMLAGQGEVAFGLWFGVAPPRGLMRQALEASR